MERIFKHITLLILSILTVCGCTDKDSLTGGISEGEYPLNITLSSDYLLGPLAGEITKQNLQIYFFKKNHGGEYLFTHAPSPDDLNFIQSTNNTVQIETTLPYSRGSEIKFIVLTDYHGEPPIQGQSFDDLNQTLTYKLVGNWEPKNPIPMSGVGELETSGGPIESKVTLIRSLAAVNVKIDSQDPKLPYKMEYLKSVRVYRTKNEVTLDVPSTNLNAAGTVIKPTEVVGALYNIGDESGTSNIEVANENPLVYQLKTSVKKIENQIFIPESYHEESATMGKVVAIVVGVSYEKDSSSDKEHYYRLDFGKYADKENGSLSPLPFFSILRNHRYNFILQGAKEPGFETPEEALVTKSTMLVDVTEWETEETDTEVNGQYYFKMESSRVHLNEDEGTKEYLPFETNIPNADLDNAISFSWGVDKSGESAYFEASVDAEKSRIIITNKQTNNTQESVRETLTVIVYKQKFKVAVEQGESLTDYVITQRHYKVNGLYVGGRPMNKDNTITLRLYARTKDSELEGLPYKLTAVPVEGIGIDYEGTFKNLVEDPELRLMYEEITIPVLGNNPGPKDKILSIMTDGYEYSLLNVKILFALSQKKVLDFYGTDSSATENLKKLLSKANFSLESGSKSIIQGAELISTTSDDMQAEIDKYKPEVIIIRNGYPLAEKHFEVMKEFISKRNEYRASNVIIGLTTSAKFIDFMKSNGIISNGGLTDMDKVDYDGKRKLVFADIKPDSPAGVHVEYRYKLLNYASDMIANGPFGDLRDKYIALAEKSKYLHKLSDPTIYKLTGAIPFAGRSGSTDKPMTGGDLGVSMFSSATFNLFWVGSDTFLNTEQDKWMFNKEGQIEDYDPSEYTFTSSKETNKMVLASNAVLFANVLNWAFYSSEYKASKAN